jgi:uncharacterized phage protein gp47/JayE
MPTFPLATLAPTLDSSGISTPSYNDILQSLIASMQSIFGSDIYLPPDSQDYQLIAIFALAISDVNNQIVAAYQGFLPTFAQGAALSSLVKINGLSREPGSNSAAQLQITGVAGTVITAGLVQDASGNLWALPLNTLIPISGAIVVTAICTQVGAINADANTINSIFNPTRGWQTATNPTAATPGTAVESDAALRRRQVQSTALPAQTPLQAILAAVANISGVQRYAIYENSTGLTDANGVPGHSISLVVLGGDIATIALVIEETKSPGTGTYGTTTEIVNDPSGVPVAINFFELEEIPIYVSLTIQVLPGFVSTTGDALKQSIADFINALAIGEEVFYNWIFGPASLTGDPLNLTYRVTAMTIGIAPAPAGVADIPVAFNAAASCDIANIILTVT